MFSKKYFLKLELPFYAQLFLEKSKVNEGHKDHTSKKSLEKPYTYLLAPTHLSINYCRLSTGSVEHHLFQGVAQHLIGLLLNFLLKNGIAEGFLGLPVIKGSFQSSSLRKKSSTNPGIRLDSER